MASRAEIERKVQVVSEPIARSAGLEIVTVLYRREAAGWVLRILIDRPGGVTVEDCSLISRELSDVLDVEDPISDRYHLEVSSPGLDRPLVKKEDFSRFALREVALRAAEPVEGRRNFRGKLLGLEDDAVMLEVDGKRVAVKWSLVEEAKLVPVVEGFPSCSRK